MSKNSLTAIIMATMLEAAPLVDILKMEKIEHGPFELYKNNEAVLVISGIGKANAAMATAYCCLTFGPKRIINLGAAGALGPSHTLGEMYHINKVIEHDRPELGSDKLHVHIPGVLPGFQTATLATGDKPVVDGDARSQLSRHADLVDMEAAAVVQTSIRFKTPCLLFKMVSDTPEHLNHSDIIKHIMIYRTSFSQTFADAVLPVLKSI
ncbi:MAG: 5'-methylthioadenosine/S-adenosylhomocysteine nucleosidase [Chloroflexi bacterium]|jgi:adenosylhomocysteine nucleosidase|nr:5'-methylthioadenosine/S-adenosylhomocysteine nucleosidase [Chloroflexota bacterium]MBT7080404.1 5'-methylthioadenosine/S-adenosylhomocysteine nucleosidase [Chloroflexota bacterium]MBT7289235.1 5'-methylthioadenosine/S-adenosylhomocysteine nucleosidase [Chloroflexota bacterium]